MANEGYKVIGVQDSSGTYEGQAYDNVNLHCIKEDAKVRGIAVEVLKMKRTLFNVMPVDVDDVIMPYYNRFGKIEKLERLPAWMAKK